MQGCVKAFTEEETMTIQMQSVSAAQNIISDDNSKKEHQLPGQLYRQQHNFLGDV